MAEASNQLEAYWIHCQRCFLFKDEGNKEFFMTVRNLKMIRSCFTLLMTLSIFQNCFHIYCQDCISHSNGKCFYCGKQNIQACKIANDMKPDIKRAFFNLGTQVKSLFNIHEFQKTHINNALKQSKKNFMVLGNQMKQLNEASSLFRNLDRNT